MYNRITMWQVSFLLLRVWEMSYTVEICLLKVMNDDYIQDFRHYSSKIHDFLETSRTKVVDYNDDYQLFSQDLPSIPQNGGTSFSTPL